MPAGTVTGTPGTVNATQTQSFGVKSGVNVAATGLAVLTSANPAGAALTAAGGLANLVSSLNHPYGTCGPGAKSADAFLACWKHAIPANFIPFDGGAPKGWNNFAYCPGASGGRAPAGGCQPGCDCTGRGCVCAPTGAVVAIPGGSFVDGSGNNLGGPVQTSRFYPTPTGMPIPGPAGQPTAPLVPQQTAVVGTPVGPTGAVIPFSAQTGAPGAVSPLSATPVAGKTTMLGAASLPSLGGISTGWIIAGVALVALLAFGLPMLHKER